MEDLKTLDKLFPLISAWGTAVRDGQDSEEHLAILKLEVDEDPAGVSSALDEAMFIQETKEKTTPIALPSDPEHPKQNQKRIKKLRELLFPSNT